LSLQIFHGVEQLHRYCAERRLADKLTNEGKDPKSLRTLFQRVFLLTDEDHQALTSVALACVATMEETRTRTAQLIEESKQTQDREKTQARFLLLQAHLQQQLGRSVWCLRSCDFGKCLVTRLSWWMKLWTDGTISA